MQLVSTSAAAVASVFIFAHIAWIKQKVKRCEACFTLDAPCVASLCNQRHGRCVEPWRGASSVKKFFYLNDCFDLNVALYRFGGDSLLSRVIAGNFIAVVFVRSSPIRHHVLYYRPSFIKCCIIAHRS